MIIVCDVESTGLKHWHHDLISCGLVALDAELNPSHTFYDKCKPWMPKNVNPETCAIHGFSIPEMMAFQEPRNMAIKMLQFLAPLRNENEYFHFVAHQNGLFDYAFLQSFFIKCELQFSFYKVFNVNHIESTIKMGRDQGFEKNNLASWAPRLKTSFNHHNALDDALMCAKIYKFLKEQKNVILESNAEPTRRVHRKRVAKIELGNGFVVKGSQLSIV